MRRVRLAGMWFAGSLMMVGAASAVSATGAGKMQQQQVRPVDPTAGAADSEANDPERIRMKDQQTKAAVDERRKRLLADTDKLLVLATELKDDVDKSTKDELSVTAVKRAEDIEKLAHQVKERIKGN